MRYASITQFCGLLLECCAGACLCNKVSCWSDVPVHACAQLRPPVGVMCRCMPVQQGRLSECCAGACLCTTKASCWSAVPVRNCETRPSVGVLCRRASPPIGIMCRCMPVYMASCRSIVPLHTYAQGRLLECCAGACLCTWPPVCPAGETAAEPFFLFSTRDTDNRFHLLLTESCLKEVSTFCFPSRRLLRRSN